jgi:hypothetical protein
MPADAPAIAESAPKTPRQKFDPPGLLATRASAHEWWDGMQAGLKQAPFLLAGCSGVTPLKLFYCNI